MSVRQKLIEQFDNLSPQLRTAAIYISRHPEAVVTQGLRKVAQEAGVSPPTLSRLAGALGLEGGYEELKMLCRQTINERQRTFGEKAKALQQYEAGQSSQIKEPFIVAQAASAIDNIQDMVDRLKPESLSAAADLLAEAPVVYVVGGLSSRPFADYLGYMSSMAFDHWEVIDLGNDPLGMTAQRLKTDGVMIVISMRPFAGRVVQLTELAAKAGLKIITISDCDLGPVSKHSQYIFSSATESPQFFSSYAATLVLLESLIAMVIRRGGEAIQERIENVENLNHRTGEYAWDSSL